MTHQLGLTHIERWTVIDPEGEPVTGATFAADQVYAPDGSTFTYTISEVGSGMYQVSWVLNQVGTYYLRLYTTDVPAQPFSVFEFGDTTDDFEVGETLIHYFTVLDDDGNYYGGSAITVDVAIDPGGSTFVPIFVDLGNGLYRVEWPATSEGVYTLRWSCDRSDTDDEPQRFEVTHTVFAVAATTSPLVSIVGTTLDDLVRAIALRCRDLVYTRSTRDSPDPSTWFDALALSALSAKSYKGASFFCYQAALDVNVAQESRVQDSTEGSLTLVEPLPGPARRGDLAYLVNIASTGNQRQTYVAAINDSISEAFPNALVDAIWTFPDTLDGDAPFLTPPAEITHIHSVSYPTPGYAPYETFIPHDDRDRAGWWWDGGSGRIVIGGAYREQGNGGVITIRGYGRHPELVSDSDQTNISRRWLVEYTAGNLIIASRDPKRMAEGQNHINRADAWLGDMATMVEANTVQIRG